MSGRRDDSLVIDDLVDAAQRLAELGSRITVTGDGPDRETADQILWNLTVLGEAAKRLPPCTRTRFSDVLWSEMAGTRDVVVHRYEGVDWLVIENIITVEIPPLLPRLREIARLLRQESDRDNVTESDESTPDRPHA